MLLTLDVGNTQTAVGLFDGETLVGHWRLTTNPDQTSDEMRLALRGVLSLGNFNSDDIHGVSISCVVPAILNPLREVAELVAPGVVTVVGPGTKTGMPITIDNPREVGADRVVNAVAARQKYGAPVVVVDFGTSTNFDVVGPNGDYLGGVIAAGLLLSTQALTRGAAALRNVELVEPRSAIGKGTVEAIQSGALYGHAGLVDGIMERVVAALGSEATRVATGGLASTIVPHCNSVEIVDPYLTLEGLRMIHDLNQESS